jgi:PAS domain S-box-containing protein
MARKARDILEFIPAAIYTTDRDGYLTYYNERAAELWGYRPEIGKQRWCGTFKIFLMDGTPVPHDQCPMAAAVQSGKPIYGIEAIGERPDGRRVPCAVFPAPIFDEHGKVTGGVNMLVDISERKAIEERQSLLVREMDHRVKNHLATIQAIMGSTMKTSATMAEFQQSFTSRITALAKTNALLTQKAHDSVPLRTLFDNELDMYLAGDQRCVTLDGPDISIPAHIAVPLGMAIHELATNAVKYGALSMLGGELSVRWEIIGDTLSITWRERGLQELARPTRIGFGTRLLTTVLPNQLNARVELKYEKDGIDVALSFRPA